MTDYNLGTARGVIEIEYNGNGAKQATADMRAAGGAADDASRRMSKAGTHLMVGGAAIAGGLALAVKSAANFEKQLSGISAVSGATDDEMEQLRTKSLQLGKDTQFSASESAQAIEELVKAGVSVQDVMNGAADATVALAAAGEVSMPEAASIASNAMNQFGLAAKDLPGVADAIAGAANASAIDVKEFGYSLSQVGAVANLAGANFEDTATAIAIMGNAGIKGSDAGTSLKSMLNNLQPTTVKQIDLMTELGIVTEDGSNRFYDQAGNLKDLADVSQVLQDSLKGMTKQQQQATLETLFGSDAIRAAAVMADNGAKGFNKMTKAMGKVTAADVAAKRMDNLEGSVEQLKGSLETLMIQIGTPLLNGIRFVVDGLTGFLNIILELDPEVLKAATTFAALASGLLLVVGAVLKFKAAMDAGSLAASLLTGPVGLVILAIAALVAAFTYFYQNNAQFRAFVQKMGTAIREYLIKGFQAVLPYLKQFGAFVKEVFQQSLPYLRMFGDVLSGAFEKALPYLKQAQAFIVRFKKIFIPIFIAMIAPILAVPIAIFALVKAFQHFYNSSAKFRAVIQAIISFVKDLASTFQEKVLPVLEEFGGKILSALVDAFREVADSLDGMMPAISDFVSSFIDMSEALYNFVHPAIVLLIGVLMILGKVFTSTVLPLLIKLQAIFIQTFVKVLGHALAAAIGIVKGFLNVISGVMKIITGLLTGDWAKAWAGVKQVLRGSIGIIKSLLMGLLKTAGAILKGLGQILLAGVKAIPGLLKGAGGLFLAAGKYLIQQFVNGMKNAAGVISGIAGNVWDAVRSLLNGAIGQINAALEFTIHLPGPDINVNPPNIPTLAKGGVLTAPTMAWVAEAGQDEAVVPLRDLWNQMDKVYRAGRTVVPDSESGSGSRGGHSAGKATSGKATLVEGRLSIDRSGRAFIRGVAIAEDADSSDYADTLRRMG